jgi:hypothetical protein
MFTLLQPYPLLLQPVCSAIAAKESLSGLETEMRKLEGLVKEVQDEMDYLKRREMRFQSTNGKSRPFSRPPSSLHLSSPLRVVGPYVWRYDSTHTDVPFPPLLRRIDQHPRAKFRSFHVCDACLSWDVADFPPEEFLPEEVFD